MGFEMPLGPEPDPEVKNEHTRKKREEEIDLKTANPGDIEIYLHEEERKFTRFVDHLRGRFPRSEGVLGEMRDVFEGKINFITSPGGKNPETFKESLEEMEKIIKNIKTIAEIDRAGRGPEDYVPDEIKDAEKLLGKLKTLMTRE